MKNNPVKNYHSIDMNESEPHQDYLASPKGEWFYRHCKEMEQSRQLAYRLEEYAFLGGVCVLGFCVLSFQSNWNAEICSILSIAAGIVTFILSYLSNQEFNEHYGRLVSREISEYVIQQFEQRFPEKVDKTL